MTTSRQPEGLLITGVYGSGKSSLAAEIADMLEVRDIAYGAVDLDWLTWFHAPGLGVRGSRRVFLDNLAAVATHYREIGIDHLILAVAVRDRDDLAAIAEASGMPLRVVRLEATLPTITERLTADPTTGRQHDLEVAAAWLTDSTGVGLEDMTLSNEDATIPELAKAVIDWLGWTDA